jgi:phosphoserine aminotransferase
MSIIDREARNPFKKQNISLFNIAYFNHPIFMNSKTYFTPGPSELYFTASDHIKQALNDKIPSISHRSKKFEGIYATAVGNIRQLLNLPDNYHVFFTGSATEIWERILQNCVEEYSSHLINGSFSERFYETALELGKKPEKFEAEEGSCVKVDEIEFSGDAELIAFTQNETYCRENNGHAGTRFDYADKLYPINCGFGSYIF